MLLINFFLSRSKKIHVYIKNSLKGSLSTPHKHFSQCLRIHSKAFSIYVCGGMGKRWECHECLFRKCLLITSWNIYVSSSVSLLCASPCQASYLDCRATSFRTKTKVISALSDKKQPFCALSKTNCRLMWDFTSRKLFSFTTLSRNHDMMYVSLRNIITFIRHYQQHIIV